MTSMQTTVPYIINASMNVILNIFVSNLKLWWSETSKVIPNKFNAARSLSNGYYAQKAQISTNSKGIMK
jgi:hypothetical protein